MALTIRLKRAGRKNLKLWRIVVTDQRAARDGQMVDELGSYDPGVNPPRVQLKADRYTEWLRKGAKPSQTVADLVRREKRSKGAN